MRRNLSSRISAKPSRHYGKKYQAVGGPLAGRLVEYKGKKLALRITVGDRETIGEYRFGSRPLGGQRGYEYLYQWFGPVSDDRIARARIA